MEFDYLFSILNSEILSQTLLDHPRFSCINFHLAPLPLYAGAHSTSWAILNNEPVYGISWHKMSNLIDGGDIIKQNLVTIDKKETALSLNLKCYQQAILSFNELVIELKENVEQIIPQNLKKRTYFSRSKKPYANGWVNWNHSADDIERLWRATNLEHYINEFSVPKFIYNNMVFIAGNIIKTQEISNAMPGTIVDINSSHWKIATKSYNILLRKLLSPEGKIYVLDDLSKKCNIHIGMQLSSPSEDEARCFQEISEKFFKNEFFWVNLLEIYRPANLPFLHTNLSEYQSLSYIKIQQVRLPEYNKSILNKIAIEHEVPLSTITLSIWLIYLFLMGNKSNLGVSYNDTTLLKIFKKEDLFFSSNLPFMVELNDKDNFPEVVSKITMNIHSINKHNRYLRDVFVRYPGLRNNLCSSNIGIMIGDEIPLVKTSLDPFLLLKISQDGTDFQWLIQSHLKSSPNFLSSIVDVMPQHFKILSNEIIRNPYKSLHYYSLLEENERNKILVEWNQTKSAYPKHINCAKLFEKQVEKYPNNIALSYYDKILTYQELNQKSNQLAHFLNNQNIKENHIIAIFSGHDTELIVCMIATLKIGATYLPVDPKAPAHHIHAILKDSNPAAVFGKKCYKNKIEDSLENISKNILVFIFEEIENLLLEEESRNPNHDFSAKNPAYVIYTSGTTGIPKGVIVSHKAINRLVLNTNYININSYDRFVQAANISFDAATFEIWGALLNGACLMGISDEILLDPFQFSLFLKNEKISILFITTSLYNEYANFFPNMFKYLNYLLVGGDVTNIEKINTVIESFPDTPKHFLIVYGPTENTTFSTAYPIKFNKITSLTLPIGKPIANSFAYILDENLSPVPIGVAGELYLGGEGLALGYLNNHILTDKKFVPNPFVNNFNEKIYNTGDIAYWLPDGNIEYVGRLDRQVKLRGYRVELEAVQVHLLMHPSINAAVAQICFINKNEKHLTAYIVAEKHSTISGPEIREFLTTRLPLYMIPDYYVFINKMPLSANGKLDYKKLPPPDLGQKTFYSIYRAPKTLIEIKLTEIWETLLAKKNISICDNFFCLGGHSLILTQLILTIDKQFQFKLMVHDFIKKPTIQNLAKLINKEKEFSENNDVIYHDLHLTESINISSSLQKRQNKEYVLLTGANGFLGIHLLSALYSDPQIKIYCLLRAKSPEEALNKLKNSSELYQLNMDLPSDRIIPIIGDISLPYLGLSLEEFYMLSKKVDIIYHNAAYVHHVYSYEMLRAENVLSIVEISKLATTFILKEIHYISTLSTVIDVFDENGYCIEDFLSSGIESCHLLDGYSQTKWVAEKILSIMRKQGVPVNIYRPGWILGSLKTGIIAPENNHLLRLIKSCIQMGYAPNWNTQLNILPVDFLSNAIIDISRNKKIKHHVFNFVNCNSISWAEMINYINESEYGTSLIIIDKEEWKHKHLPLISKDNALFNLLPLYTSTNISWIENLEKFNKICDKHVKSAFKCLGLHYPQINKQSLKKYFNFLNKDFLQKGVNTFDKITDKNMIIAKAIFNSNIEKYLSDPFFTTLLQNSGEIIILLDEKGNICKINSNAEKYYLCNNADVVNTNFETLCIDSGKDVIFSHNNIEYFLKNHTKRISPPLRLNTSQTNFIEWNIFSLKKENGINFAYLILGKDITDKKIIEKQNKKIQDYLENIASCMPGNFYWKDKDGHYLGCNDATLKVIGFHTKSQLIGKTDYDLWPEQAEQLLKNDKEAMDGGKTIYLEETVDLKGLGGHGLQFFTVIKTPLLDPEGNVVGIIGNSLDITELKDTQQALKEAKEKAEAASLTKSEFIANMSHDIHTPLTGILGMAEILATTNADPHVVESMQIILTAGRNLLSLLNDILETSRLELGYAPDKENNIELHQMLRELQELFLPVMQNKNLYLNIHIDPQIPSLLSCHSVMVHRILLNLISNACKFTEKGGITISVHLLNKKDQCYSIKFSIADTGIGIPSDKLHNIFEPFTRLSPSYQGIHKGVGLGLHIVQQFVNILEGTIGIESTPGKGTIFLITLPFFEPN